MATSVSQLFADPSSLRDWTHEDLFSIPPDELEEAQLVALQERYEEMRPQIRIVDRLADDIEINRIDRLADITPLCLPHTTYKSYSAAHVEAGRYDRMTRWLSGLTAHDLARVDLAGVDSLEGWLAALDDQTPLRLLTSSGTSGKMSFFPRSVPEESAMMGYHFVQHSGYRAESDSRLVTGEVDYYSLWTVATGHHSMPALFRLLRQLIYAGEEHRLHTLGKGHWDADLIWISGRLRAAEARGELAQLELTPKMKELQGRLAEQQQNVDDNIDQFMDEVLVGTAGQRVFFFCQYPLLIPFARRAKARGLTAQFSDDSYVLAGQRSGSKGTAYPDGWYELCKSIIPHEHQAVYGMTELTSSARMCSRGNFHYPPWIIQFLLDPDTSEPLPREGVQTGRFAPFDLWPRTHWGGTISGDQVTIDWRGGCACGRTGPFISPEIGRYANLRDDDKITCSKSPDAYAKAVELTLSID
jgi:hypothetical protein